MDAPKHYIINVFIGIKYNKHSLGDYNGNFKMQRFNVVFDITVTMGSTTMNLPTVLAQAVEGHEITTGEYEDIAPTKNLTINQQIMVVII